MGNNNSTVSNANAHQKKWKFLKSKISNLVAKSNDDFFIKYIQNNKDNIDITSLDQRRHIFISLLGLYQTWKKIPHISLYSAVFVLPLKKDWIYNPSKHASELQASLISKISIFSDMVQTAELIQLLKWKDSQGLCLFMLDYDYEQRPDNDTPHTPHTKNRVNKINELVHSFWYALNDKLCSLYDPITGTNYQPLQFDVKWWQNNNNTTVKTSSILSELYFLTMKFDSMSQVIYQSNPNSLFPVKSYPVPIAQGAAIDMENQIDIDDDDDDDDEEEKTNWCVLDYDPYEIDDFNNVDNSFTGCKNILNLE